MEYVVSVRQAKHHKLVSRRTFTDKEKAWRFFVYQTRIRRIGTQIEIDPPLKGVAKG